MNNYRTNLKELVMRLFALAFGVTIGSSLVYLSFPNSMPVKEWYKLLACIILATWIPVIIYEIYKMLRYDK